MDEWMTELMCEGEDLNLAFLDFAKTIYLVNHTFRLLPSFPLTILAMVFDQLCSHCYRQVNIFRSCLNLHYFSFLLNPQPRRPASFKPGLHCPWVVHRVIFPINRRLCQSPSCEFMYTAIWMRLYICLQKWICLGSEIWLTASHYWYTYTYMKLLRKH